MANFQSYTRPHGPHEATSLSSQRPQRHLSDQSAYATMQDWIRAFPRPRLGRVVKPRSAGNSPSAAIGRRTTVGQSAMYSVPSQYQQSSLEATYLASAAQQSRPISWHPSSVRSRTLSNPTWTPEYPTGSLATEGMLDTQMHGLPTDPVSTYSLSAGPDSQTGYFPAYTGFEEPLPVQQQTSDSMGWDGSSYFDYSSMNHSLSDPWSMEMLTSASNIPPTETACPSYASVPSPGEISGPSTPDFLPIQQFDDEPALNSTLISQPQEEELVGMGLYSQPSTAQNSLQQGLTGKGLKLEETFSPSEDEDEDADADADADADGESDEDSSDSRSMPPPPQPTISSPLPPASHSPWSGPKQTSKQALNLLHKSFFFDNDDSDQLTMAATQPFTTFTQPCMTYGHGWI
ncbi:Uncharacterized protein PECH_003341 [Penicillium ucsense]|uniref:Uncharacterized protein n=1 Tax=Penicillium ucsense TaxID=2839758 RepID=A0A8J8WMI2_9EURO|nr:Uncharacterized protein PECM_000151 [Penicillium ucsense]KAF7739365.1 Uncharacterized protein PECH_003341 [Penicillium ucsense]